MDASAYLKNIVCYLLATGLDVVITISEATTFLTWLSNDNANFDIIFLKTKSTQ